MYIVFVILSGVARVCVFRMYLRMSDPPLDSKVRLVTLELTIKLLTQLIISEGHCVLRDSHLAAIEAAREQSTSLLKNFYKVRFMIGSTRNSSSLEHTFQ